MHDVVIIGGGLSGILTAMKCREHQRDALILEASERLGGRIHTVPAANGACLELGANWIHSADVNPIAPLLARLGLEWVESNPEPVIFVDGKTLDGAKLNTALAEANLVAQEWGKRFRFPVTHKEFFVFNGLNSIFNHVLKEVAIRVKSPVTMIDTSQSDAVKLTLASGEELLCKQVIIATGLMPILRRRVRFIPSLPKALEDYFSAHTPMILHKIWLELDCSLPDGYLDRFMVDIMPQGHVLLYAPRMIENHLCVMREERAGADSNAPTAFTLLIEQAMAAVGRIHGHACRVKNTYQHDWVTDVWQGCSHFFPPALPYQSLPTHHLDARVSFVGDYASSGWNGQMAGCYEAHQLLNV